jgi:hypothetical protein
MTRSAPRSIDQYLRQVREELAGEDAARAARRSVRCGDGCDGAAERLV